MAKQRITILGNCVAHRLQFLLKEHPAFSAHYELVPSPMIHLLTQKAELDDLATLARTCDILFTQPLFNFEACNTAVLQANKPDGQTIHLFSAPNFEAYFPDVLHLDNKTDLKFEPTLDWDSRIIFSCFVTGVPIFDVEQIYVNNRLFRKEPAQNALHAALETYARREQGVDLQTGGFVFRNYAATRLFYTWQHPTETLMGLLLDKIILALDLPRHPMQANLAAHSFGFNQWPIITRHHSLFKFPEQAYFLIAGVRYSIEDVAMAYYNFYEFHPHIVEANKEKLLTA